MTTGSDALQDRATAVKEALGEGLKHSHFKHYANLVLGLPLMLNQHGLGQTLAYLQLQGAGRPNSPSMLLSEQLARRLAQLYPIAGDNLLAHLTKLDSSEYRRLAEEASEFALTLRQALWIHEEGK